MIRVKASRLQGSNRGAAAVDSLARATGGVMLWRQSNSLRVLAGRIQAEHAAAETAKCTAVVVARKGLEHAMAAGALLNEAKSLVPHGQWGRISFLHKARGEVGTARQWQAFQYFGYDVEKFAPRFAEVGFVVMPFKVPPLKGFRPTLVWTASEPLWKVTFQRKAA